jgi:putative sigma-54 modulation protein
MKVTYTGKTKDFTAKLEKKIQEKLTKLGKMIEQRGEREVHVVHQVERHLHHVEFKINFYDHALLGVAADPDLIAAVAQALEKLEKQIVKTRTKWRDTHRDPKSTREKKELMTGKAAPAGAPAPKSSKAGGKVAVAATDETKGLPKVFRVDHSKGQKPMTLEEAVIAMERGADYVVYRDPEKSRLTVLLRRRDGNFDLVEG